MPDTIILTETPVSEIPPVEAPATEADVKIAKIEAERDVTIAEIHAEAEGERMDAVLEVAADEDETDLTLEGVEECRRNIETLETKVDNLTALISERLPPAPPPPPDPNPDAPSESTPAETEVPPAPPPAKTKKSRWI